MRRSLVALLVAGLLFTACDSHQGEVESLQKQVGDLQDQVQANQKQIAKLQRTAQATESSLRECLDDVIAGSKTLAASVRYLARSNQGLFGPSVDFSSTTCGRAMGRQDLKKLKALMFQAGRVVDNARFSTLRNPASTSNGVSSSSGATAICNDGTYSYSQHASGTCSWHGGVSQWLNYPGN